MGLHRYAVLTASATFVLLLVGGLVHGTGSSLACPDWPLCHGQFFPEMTHGVEYEHTHRLVAGGVALLTAGLAVALWLDARMRPLRPLAVAAPIMVLVQALLGGLTVIFRLPRPITLSHLTLSMLFFSVLVILAVRTRFLSTAAVGSPPPPAPPALRRLRPAFAATIGALLGQIFLGGVVRHSMAGLACPDVPFCFGSAWPGRVAEQLQMGHRYLAVVVALMVVVHAVLLRRRLRAIPGGAGPDVRLVALGRLAIALPVVVLLQVTLGVLSVTSLLHLHTVTAHLGGAALLLAGLVATHTLLGEPAPGLRAASDPGVDSAIGLRPLGRSA